MKTWDNGVLVLNKMNLCSLPPLAFTVCIKPCLLVNTVNYHKRALKAREIWTICVSEISLIYIVDNCVLLLNYGSFLLSLSYHPCWRSTDSLHSTGLPSQGCLQLLISGLPSILLTKIISCSICDAQFWCCCWSLSFFFYCSLFLQNNSNTLSVLLLEYNQQIINISQYIHRQAVVPSMKGQFRF